MTEKSLLTSRSAKSRAIGEEKRTQVSARVEKKKSSFSLGGGRQKARATPTERPLGAVTVKNRGEKKKGVGALRLPHTGKKKEYRPAYFAYRRRKRTPPHRWRDQRSVKSSVIHGKKKMSGRAFGYTKEAPWVSRKKGFKKPA